MILIGRGKIVASGTKDELLSSAEHKTSYVTALDNELLTKALRDKGFDVAPAGTGLRVEAAPVEVGRVAAEQSHRPHRPALRGRRARGAVPRAHRGLASATTPPGAARRPHPPKEPRHEHRCRAAAHAARRLGDPARHR